ncbi:MAG: flagellar hook protein FlgE [Burkholderiaceae bacterium]|nr:flagellar hook protein FlgE [Burkholderiaceae bacterium]
MSFQQGLSGLSATSKNLEVIGNNIANAGTYGAKSSRAEFGDMYATAINGAGSAKSGIGVNLLAVAQQFTQGNTSTTGNPMDLSINGRGFFQVSSPSGETLYSRNGQFKLDREGYVVNNTGDKLLAQGWNEAAGRAAGDAAPIRLQSGLGDPVATGAGSDLALRGVRLAINLDARKDVPATAMSFTQPDSYNFSTSQTLYDSQGAPLTMNYYFRKTAANAWDVYASVNGQAFDGPTPATGLVTSMTFDAQGQMTAPAVMPAINVIDPRATPLATPLFAALPINFTGTSQYAAGFSISELKQDGFASGELTGITFDTSGVVKASYSNGRSTNLAQLQLADFTNLQGLQPLGSNLWKATYASGEPTGGGAPGSGTYGALQAGALEESNVDLTGELVNLITAQRMYQANAQTISTQSEILQTLTNLR